jgi:hypothetical protein
LGIYRYQKVEVKCLTCGIDFYKLPNQIKKTANHFCSRKCSAKNQDQKVEVKCIQCKEAFYKTRCQIKKTTNHFCSIKCSAKNQDQKVEVKCLNCGMDLYKKPSSIKRSSSNFCSRECKWKHQDQKVEVKCLNCNKFFLKKQDQIQKKPRHCCSIQCFKTLAKYNKNWGSSRSKLEVYTEKKLTEELTLNISYNDTSIGYELDIYLPEMNFAIELNGVFHYKAIYGEKSLLKRQEIDRLKAEECVKRNIKLIVINVSEDKDNKRTLEKRYNEIKSLILNRFEEYKQQSSQPITLEF